MLRDRRMIGAEIEVFRHRDFADYQYVGHHIEMCWTDHFANLATG
jgi:hypothetical protein